MLVWNVAADLEIDDDIERDKTLALPEEAVSPAKMNLPEDLTAEEYYDLLLQEAKECERNCGSGAHGVTQPWEGENGEAKGRAKIESYEGDAIARATAERILEERSRGTVPNNWVRWAEAYSTPKVDWRKELASAIRRAAGDVRGLVDYTYRVPSRRQSAFGEIVMPAMVKPNPKVAIVVDTSGSMGESDLLSMPLCMLPKRSRVSVKSR
jgi:predicted metal-dependent peptidase